MIEPRLISLRDARLLLNFGASDESRALADQQLKGAVAAHNAIVRRRFAYVADEVGTGKTYIALGVVGLLRHFHPSLRTLVIAPRANIQEKWVKELENFTRTNWRSTDLRVRGLQGFPAHSTVVCRSLEDFAREAARNRDRDFFLRLPSFSLQLRAGEGGWNAKREGLYSVSRGLRRFRLEEFRGKGQRDQFKDQYARAVNSIIPDFDLVIVDEAHNLKHGRQSDSTRNRLLSIVLGTAGDANVELRAQRVLLLSATPFETDFAELWNQLDLLGKGRELEFRKLADPAIPETEKRKIAHAFLFRRLTALQIGGRRHTKNMYRREWRGGGVSTHDAPLQIPDARQQLVVALVQKKVAEVLRDQRFKASFQIGMLASFESFFETAKIQGFDPDTDEAAAFDQGEQTDDELEREGVDSEDIGILARSYRRTFGGQPLPHPKMDAVTDSVAEAFQQGQKTLVFVRRVKSVPELAEKLARKYDAWLFGRLRAMLKVGSARNDLERAIEGYQAQLATRRAHESDYVVAGAEASGATEQDPKESRRDADRGGNETFFSWFFRGDNKVLRGFLTGASFRRNRLQNEGSSLSTFFEDNYLSYVLGDPPPSELMSALAGALGMSEPEAAERVRTGAAGLVRGKPGRLRRLDLYHAFQEAALVLLTKSRSKYSRQAEVVWVGRYGRRRPGPGEPPPNFPDATEYLSTRTFFSAARVHPELSRMLRHGANHQSLSGRSVPKSLDADRFRAREQRRELLAATARLGHTLVELWAVAIRLGGTMRTRQRESPEASEGLVDAFIQHLCDSRTLPGLSAWRELADVARHHELLLDVNFPEARHRTLPELGRYFADVLGNQLPVAGIFGGVSRKVVKQFRMPGYPLALIATEVLQEGEDLHTFCSRVVHYGISWTPSAMEQRVGRIDRIGSLTHRSLADGPRLPRGDEKLQVFYPYLVDTVEFTQVKKVLSRLNEFMRLAHLGPKRRDGSRIFLDEVFASTGSVAPAIEGELETPWDVLPIHTTARPRRVQVSEHRIVSLKHRFEAVFRHLNRTLRIDWNKTDLERGEVHGTAYVRDDKLLRSNQKGLRADGYEVRIQPFVVFLRTAGLGARCLVHVVSPVGRCNLSDGVMLRIARDQEVDGAKVCLLPDRTGAYNLTVEGDHLFEPRHLRVEDVVNLLSRVVVRADQIELEYLRGDGRYTDFQRELMSEARRAAN